MLLLVLLLVLQVVLSDLQGLQASWEEEEEEDDEEEEQEEDETGTAAAAAAGVNNNNNNDVLTEAEAALVEQLSSSPLMPDDFDRWGLRIRVRGGGAQGMCVFEWEQKACQGLSGGQVQR